MPRKKSPPKDDILEETKPIEETKDVEEPLEKAVKPKNPRTPKQIEAFNKMLAAQNEKKKAKAAANKEDKNQTVELLKALEVIKENSNSEKVDKIKSNPKLVDDAKRTVKGRGRPKKEVKLPTPEPSDESSSDSSLTESEPEPESESDSEPEPEPVKPTNRKSKDVKNPPPMNKNSLEKQNRKKVEKQKKNESVPVSSTQPPPNYYYYSRKPPPVFL